MKDQRLFRLFFTFMFCGLPSFAHADVRCHLHSIQGMEQTQARGEKIISGRTTVDPQEMRVYLSIDHGNLYAQSNFISGDAEYPTKLLTSEPLKDAEIVAINLEDADTYEKQQTVTSSLQNVSWYVDKGVFADPSYKDFDFRGGHVLVVGSDDVARESRVAFLGSARRRFLQIVDHVYAPVDEEVEHLLSSMNDASFEAERVGILPLVKNSATLEAFSRIPAANRAELNEDSTKALFRTLDQWSGKTLFVVGHVEDTDFVMKDSVGQVLLSVNIDELKEYGRTHKVNIVAIGCNSAVHVGTGAANAFNTLDAVSNFATALSADTWLRFLSTFANQNLDLVINKSMIDEAGKLHLEISVYRNNWRYFAPVGTMSGVLLPNDATGAPWYVWGLGVTAVLFLGRKTYKWLRD